MSHLWHFYSYDHEQLAALDASTVAEALLWDDGAIDDPSAVERLAVHIAKNGLSYDGLSPDNCDLLDELVPGIFSPEGLESELNVQPESYDGVHPSIVREMLAYIKSASILPWLIHGHRHNSASTDADCNYAIFEPAQVSRLLAECNAVMDAQPTWSESDFPDVIRGCLIASLRSIEAKNKYAIGVVG